MYVYSNCGSQYNNKEGQTDSDSVLVYIPTIDYIIYIYIKGTVRNKGKTEWVEDNVISGQVLFLPLERWMHLGCATSRFCRVTESQSKIREGLYPTTK